MPNKRSRGWSNSARRKKVVKRLVERDGLACYYCTRPLDLKLRDPNGYEVTVEHIVPRAYGGSNAMSNLALAHSICNEIAGNAYEDKMRKEGKSKNGQNA